ncbi:MAG: hypothetical protein ACLPPV_16875 [Candidatus Korobacteraceae bacterium]
MGRVAGSTSQEYWRPPNPEVMRLVIPVPPGTPCGRCGTDYAQGAHFCHICGTEREARATNQQRGSSPHSLGLPLTCLVFFVIGILCMMCAALTGMIYKAQTMVDWQAIQTWRIEWLLGATAALLAGILLKRKV